MIEPTFEVTTIRADDRTRLWCTLLDDIDQVVGSVIAGRRLQLTDAGLYLLAHDLRHQLSEVLLDAHDASGGSTEMCDTL